ncbi:MAG: excinuclease ABC subunit UvrA [Thermoanaerobaculia bacterium]
MRPREARAIEVAGARTHNLKGVSCRVPIGAITVVTGPSGSGKSSLAFDTLYAEGQRRFVESMSTYARQFLERMERPDVERIDHLLPAIALEQKAAVRSARSTVGTATEIHDVLRLLFAAAGTVVCPSCGLEVRRDSPASVADALVAELGEGARLLVLAPRPAEGLAERAPLWVRSGLFRAVAADGSVVSFDAEAPPPAGPDGLVRLVVGRHVLRGGDAEVAASLDGAFAVGEGTLLVRDAATGRELRFLRGLACNGCGRTFEEPTPAHFSFNSPRGACRACEGFGRIAGLDAEKVLPDTSRTLLERPFAPFNTPAYASAYPDLWRACKRLGIRKDVPWNEMTPRERELVWNGDGDWYGVKGLFDWLETKRYKVQVRVMIARYRGYERCPECRGARLAAEARAVRVGGATLPSLCDLPLDALLERLRSLPLGPVERARGGALVADAAKRVGTLVDVGLSYLTLSRTTRTLSGGEAQRVQLAAALGNALTGTLYVLDEPTVGLHPADTARLLVVLRRLADAGNAVCVVEHDLDVIRAADHVVDLGPRAGAHGGSLVFEGTPKSLERAATATGEALRTTGAAGVAERSAPYPRGSIRIVGARANNLANLTVEVPTGVLAGVCGPSGSGKSSLVVDVLASGALRVLGRREADALEKGEHERIEGLPAFHDVVLVDQSPLGRSARSNPATYTKAWDEVRALWARSPAARAAGLTKGSFSFNAPGGRCERCEGSGVVTVDMQFLADVTVVCDACDGRRFTPEVLGVRVRGRNVHELLGTTVDEAIELFADLPGIVSRLAPLSEAGLGYLRLGQSTATLSGGEAQRLKVASFLKAGAARPTLFLFDEPTTGLHAGDVDVLLGVFRRLLAAGHSVLAVEHNPAFLLACDWLLELGPGGGAEGGRVVFAGGVPELLARGTTATAEALRASSGAPARLQSAPPCPKGATATSSSSTAGRSTSRPVRSRSAGAAPRPSASTTSPSRGATRSSRSRTGKRSSRT